MRKPTIGRAGHCYLDVPDAEPSAEAAQAHSQRRAGLRLYATKTVADALDPEPTEPLGPAPEAQVAGVEATIWPETISDFNDLPFPAAAPPGRRRSQSPEPPAGRRLDRPP